MPLKSLNIIPLEESQPIDALPDEGAREGDAELKRNDANQNLKAPKAHSEVLEMDITEEKLTELIGAAVTAGVDQAMKALPAKVEGVKVVKDEADQLWEHDG